MATHKHTFATFRGALLAASIALGAAALSWAPARVSAAPGDDLGDSRFNTSSTELPGVTKPSQESNLAFGGPGIVTQVLVKAGDAVKAGQVVAQEDDREEMAKLAAAQAEFLGEDKQIEAADADLELKKVTQRRFEELYADLIKQNRTNTEIDEARANVKIAQIASDYRRIEKHEKQLAVGLAQVDVDKRKLVCPIDGIVAKIDIHPGDGVDLTKPGIQVVNNEPLWVEVEIPTVRAKTLRMGQSLNVRYVDDQQTMPARVIFLTPYANAGSGTRHVRLEMANTARREAGVPVLVQLPETLADSRQ